MNDLQNTITIKPLPENGDQDAVIFKAPNDSVTAHGLWLFLVRKLQPGFVVELTNGTTGLSLPSGEAVSPDMYTEIMNKAQAV